MAVDLETTLLFIMILVVVVVGIDFRHGLVMRNCCVRPLLLVCHRMGQISVIAGAATSPWTALLVDNVVFADNHLRDYLTSNVSVKAFLRMKYRYSYHWRIAHTPRCFVVSGLDELSEK
jgi:hypothetical protein